MNWFEFLFKVVFKVYFLHVHYERGIPVLLDEKGVCLTPLNRFQFIESYYHYDGRQIFLYEHRQTKHWTVYTLDKNGRVLRVKTLRRASRINNELIRIEDEGYYELERVTNYGRVYVTTHPVHGILYRVTGKHLPHVLFEGNENVTLQVAESVNTYDEPFEFGTYWAPFVFYRAQNTPSIIQLRWSSTNKPIYTGPCFNDPPL